MVLLNVESEASSSTMSRGSWEIMMTDTGAEPSLMRVN